MEKLEMLVITNYEQMPTTWNYNIILNTVVEGRLACNHDVNR